MANRSSNQLITTNKDMKTMDNDLNAKDMNEQNNEFSKIDLNMDYIDSLEDRSIRKQKDMNMEKVKRNNPIEKEEQRVTSLQENNGKIDDRYQKEIEREWTIPEKIFNKSGYKTVVAHRKELFSASAEYKIKFYRTVLDGRLEALSEKTNTGLTMIKAHYRQAAASFMMNKMNDLAKEVKLRQDEFLEMMMEKHDKADSLQNYPELKNQYNKSILSEGERYMEFLDRLVMRFENIIDEQLQKYN